MTKSRKLEIEKEAEDFRKSKGINTCGITNIFELCDTEYYLIRYPVGENGILGAAFYRAGEYVVFSNSSVIRSREIFTVAHEIGHIRLGHLGTRQRMITDHDHDIDSRSEQEKEANYFAACLLMPQDDLRKFMRGMDTGNLTPLEIAKIMGVFGVSFDTVINRLKNTDIITQSERDSLLAKKNETKVTELLRAINVSTDLCKPENVKNVPSDFLKWVQFNYQKHVIPRETVEKAVGYLDGVSANALIGDIAEPVDNDCDDLDLDSILGEDE